MRRPFKGYGFLQGAISLFLLLQAVSAPLSAGASGPLSLPDVLKQAETERLYSERYWNILLHYKPSKAGLVSLVDDPLFFLSPQGKADPKAELEATLAGFFAADAGDQEHPRCRFPARYAWLTERLGIDASSLPPVSCPKLDEALKAVNPKSTVLVFPAAHISGPASMFGHTLLRVDSGFESELISHAITYAATATDTNGLVYAYKGIFGYYHGNYSILPYYEKVKEYNDMEHRDLWEYHLNLTEAETYRLVLHMWELKDVYSDYFFFDENCSYSILFLLEAARPSVNLTDRRFFKFWVIPADTIRDVEQSGLVRRVKYRPSLGTRIRALASRMEQDRLDTALSIAKSKIAPDTVDGAEMPDEEKMKTLDLAADVIQYQYSRREIGKDEYQKLFLSTLKARSKLGKPANDTAPIVAPPAPEQGHLSSRLGVGLGYRRDSLFNELKWRGAYHDLLDPDEGYVEGYQINFFNASFRYYYNDHKLQFRELHFIDIFSASPRDLFLKPISWKAKTGFEQKVFPDGKERMVYHLTLGGGLTYHHKHIGLLYGLLEADVSVGGVYQDNFAAGAGAQVGMIKKLTDSWKMNLSAETLVYGLGEKFQEHKASLSQTDSLNASLSWQRVDDIRLREAIMNWNYYF